MGTYKTQPQHLSGPLPCMKSKRTSQKYNSLPNLHVGGEKLGTERKTKLIRFLLANYKTLSNTYIYIAQYEKNLKYLDVVCGAEIWNLPCKS